MTCTLTKIDSISSENIENAYICESRKLIAVTTPDLKLKVLSFAESLSEPTLVREFKNHVGAILGLAFAPPTHHTYIITIGYDKTLNLYNLDDPKMTEPVYSYTEENDKVGYFTCVTFLPSEKSRLAFLVGSSTGYFLTFDSHSNFECKYKEVANGQIKSITANEEGDVIVAAVGASPKLFFGFDFENGFEFPQNGQNLLKTTQVRFSSEIGLDEKSYLLSVCDDQSVGVWELDHNVKMLRSVQILDLKTSVLYVQWNLGAMSFNAFCGRKEEKLSDLKVFRISSFERGEEESWKISPVEIKTD